MLEILILLGTCKKISSLCKERGLKPLNYNLLNILGYFLSIYGFFVLGFFLSDQFNNSSFPIIGLCTGIGLFVFINYSIKNRIKETAIAKDNDIEEIGVSEN